MWRQVAEHGKGRRRCASCWRFLGGRGTFCRWFRSLAPLRSLVTSWPLPARPQWWPPSRKKASRLSTPEGPASLPPAYGSRCCCPNIVVCDEADFGVVVAAERLGLPYATVQSTASGSVVPSGVVAEQANQLRVEHGLPPDPGLEMLRRYLVLVPFPPRFRDPGSPLPPTAHALRHVVPDLPLDESAFPWLASVSDSELVYVTLGTIFNQESGDLFERIVGGVRDLPVDVVATVGRALDPEVLGPQPPNVHVERYIPQAQLLPHCRLVVSHGGSGSVIGALAHGLPMVVIPIGADQPRNAQRCRDLHVARVLHALEATPDRVRAATSDVLADPTYRLNAEGMRDEIAALPGPDHAVTLLERLAKERQPLLSR